MKHIRKIIILFAAFMAIVPAAFAGPSGGWQNQDIKVKGTWSIEERADGNYLVLSDDFKTKKAPDLKLFFSNKSYDTINGKNATQEATFLSLLSSHKGGQSYKIPSSVDVGSYKSLVIHCEQYSKLWASTPLK